VSTYRAWLWWADAWPFATLRADWVVAYTRIVTAHRAWVMKFLLACTWVVATYRAERVAIPLGILEILVCSYKIVNGKVVFIVKKSCASSDNLLKLNHIIDGAHEHDIAHVAGIHTCGEFLRGGENNGE
jgi:hypothetical protein